MKITRPRLMQIIKEELEVVLTDSEAAELFGDQVGGGLKEQLPGRTVGADIAAAQVPAAPTAAPPQAIPMQTLGDLKRTIAQAIKAKRIGNAKDAALEALKGLPFSALGPGKDLLDIAKAAYKLPDDVKVGPGLKSLDVDDDVSAIVDDNLEDAFLKTLDKELKSGAIPDDTLLTQLDMTKMLSNFIASRHDKRIVVKPETP